MIVPFSAGTETDASWKMLGFGDFDGDGDDDVFFRNSSTGATAMWLMNGRTIAMNIGSTPVSDMNWQMHAIGDFNGDGKDELIWRNVVSGAVSMWEMNGATLVNGATFYTVTDLHWEIQLAADFTGDGKDELLWRNNTTGQLAMWEMNGRTGGNCGSVFDGHSGGGYAFCGGIDPPADLSVPNPDALANYGVPSSNYWPLLQFTHGRRDELALHLRQERRGLARRAGEPALAGAEQDAHGFRHHRACVAGAEHERRRVGDRQRRLDVRLDGHERHDQLGAGDVGDQLHRHGEPALKHPDWPL